jgi:hypothetical protein
MRSVQVLLGSNPGGPGHGWLKRRFVRPAGAEVGPRQRRAPRGVAALSAARQIRTRYMATRVHPRVLLRQRGDAEVRSRLPRAVILPIGGAKARQLAYGDWDSERRHDVRARLGSRAHRPRTRHGAAQRSGSRRSRSCPGTSCRRATGWRGAAAVATIYGSIDYGYGAPWSFHLHAILPGGHIRTFFEFYKAGVRDSEQARMIRIASSG